MRGFCFLPELQGPGACPGLVLGSTDAERRSGIANLERPSILERIGIDDLAVFLHEAAYVPIEQQLQNLLRWAA